MKWAVICKFPAVPINLAVSNSSVHICQVVCKEFSDEIRIIDE